MESAIIAVLAFVMGGALGFWIAYQREKDSIDNLAAQLNQQTNLTAELESTTAILRQYLSSARQLAQDEQRASALLRERLAELEAANTRLNQS